MTSHKKQVLGKGLSSLFSSAEEKESLAYQDIPLQQIVLGAYQPRKNFNETTLQELAISIGEKGILQPLLVRALEKQATNTPCYELIAGERRMRAAKLAGLSHVPCHILNSDNRESLEINLLENIQRDNLVCIEEATGYQRLIQEFHYTQEVLSEKLGKSRSYITNSLRLLQLPAGVQELLITKALTLGHGKALLGSKDPERLARTVISRGLSVRQTEALVRKEENPEGKNPLKKVERNEEEALAYRMSELTGLPVEIVLQNQGGRIQFIFKTLGELDCFLEKLTQAYQKDHNETTLSRY